ncbi:MAG: ABC transporter ATP-binding protein [Phycisphaerae bacterium]|nr:ABC transporter ATP-binding protein [Phycisphaerae bacterium]
MLRLENLRKAFGSTVAVDGLSLTVRRGEVFGLLGPNGAGKSTTMAMAVGLLAPDSGRVLIGAGAGASPSDPSVRLGLGLAPQSLALYDELSGEENVTFFARLQGLSGRDLRGRVAAALELVGLGPRKGDRAKGYSGGMKRRLNLAAALVHDPPLLLLDEPTAGVDPQSRVGILDLVQSVAARGTTVVYTTHYMEEAQRLCERVAIMDLGKIIAIGTIEELIDAHGGGSVLTVRRNGGPATADERVTTTDPVRELTRVMTGPDAATIRGVTLDRPDLESVFLTLTGRRLRD